MIAEAILKIDPNAQVSVMGEAKYSNITWLNDTTPIAEQDILDKQDELWSAYQTKEYQRKIRISNRKVDKSTKSQIVKNS